MGYIIAGVVFAVGILLVVFLLGGRGGRTSRGRLAPDGAQPVERQEPAADEPTPGVSATASGPAARRAQERTPPS